MWPAFISVEGGEGAGKSTLVSFLKEVLEARGYSVVATREPGGCALSESIRSLLLRADSELPISAQAELQLFLAARVQHIEELILPALQKGQIILCDRFNDSTIAYQGVARGLGREFVEQLCLLSCRGVVPALTFFLDIPEKEGLSRIAKRNSAGPDRIEKEGEAFHKLVLEGLRQQALLYPERIVTIQGIVSKEEVGRQALQIVETHLEKHRKDLE
jgi:dTMP kinase